MKQSVLVIVLGAVAQYVAAEPPKPPQPPLDASLNQAPRLTAENIDKKTEILRNPELAVDNAKAVLSGETAAPKPSVPSLENSPKKIGDPTQMTGSFSQALSRIHGKPGAAGGGATPVQPTMPQIDLTAKVYLQGSKAVMLKIGDKSHLIKEGGKFSVLDKNTLYEIQVDRIEHNGVTISVMPPGQKLILE